MFHPPLVSCFHPWDDNPHGLIWWCHPDHQTSPMVGRLRLINRGAHPPLNHSYVNDGKQNMVLFKMHQFNSKESNLVPPIEPRQTNPNIWLVSGKNYRKPCIWQEKEWLAATFHLNQYIFTKATRTAAGLLRTPHPVPWHATSRRGFDVDMEKGWVCGSKIAVPKIYQIINRTWKVTDVAVD